MITKLTLKDFGKFKGVSFPLKPVTLFIGENESGKSTLFDALFEQLCAPKGSSLQGKRLKDRYGEGRLAAIEFDGAPFALDPEEFLNLFAISSSDLFLDLAPGSPWLERVKSRLFSGGIDPSHLADLLDRDAKTSGNYAQVKEGRKLEALREAAASELEEMRRRREELLAQEKQVHASGGRLSAAEADITAKESEVVRLTRLVDQQRAIAERAGLAETLGALTRIEEASRRERELSAFRVDGSGELRRLESAEREAQNSLAAAQERRRTAEGRRAQGERKEQELRARREGARTRAEVATELRRLLEGRGARRLAPLVIVIMLAAAGALGAAAGAGLVPLLLAGLGAAIGAAFGAAALLVVALVVMLLVQAGPGPGSGGVVSARDEWHRRLPDAPPLASEGYGGLIAELASREREADEAAERLTELERERQTAEDEARQAAVDCERAESALRQARAEIASWLTGRGVATSQAYLERLRDYTGLARVLESERARIAEAMKRLRVADEAALKAECLVRISKLDGVIASEPVGEGELRRAEGDLAAIREELMHLRAEKERLLTALSGGLGEVRGSLGDLPARILAKEREVGELAAKLEELTLSRRAAALARDLFQELARDSDVLLDRLAAEIGRSFGDLIRSERPVSLERLELGAIAVTDAGGMARPVDLLSHGTRDSFLFAARLTLAAQSREGEGILILDDPFPALDERRVESALAFLARFRERSGWQLILFSKELSLERSARALFGEVEVVRLT